MSQPPQLKEIDGCEALVLVDNVSDPLSTVPQGVTSEIPNLLRAGARELAGSCMCCAQWGLALVLTATIGDQRTTLLFDSGPEGYGLERNGARLGVDFGAIDAVVLSHGHFDHVGGMTTALALISRAKGRRPTPVHVNAGMFVDRATVRADGSLLPLGKVPSPAELEAVGGELVMAEAARLLLDGAFYLSGEIPRVTPYEQGLKGQVRSTPGGGWEPDELILDERFLAVHLRDRGIFVFTACSHAGIVNVLSHARDLFDPIPLHGVMGGFHLSGSYCESIISETIEGLRGFGLERLVPGHCTGWRATGRLVETFGEARVTPSAVGQRHAI
jgi:7,8-dihydropterin-6-yl-methyl-4-(beta-D-ribofuranosyl)aminobenzene 5'-phosphate synthase